MYSVNNAAPFSGSGSAVSTAWGKFICVSVLEYLIPYEDVKSFPGGPAGPISPLGPVSPLSPFGPVSPLSPLGPVSPLSPFGILLFKIAFLI